MDKIILNFHKFEDMLPIKYKEILHIYNSPLLPKYTCAIRLFTDAIKYSNDDYWCYTKDIINTVIYENNIDKLLYSLAENKEIPVEVSRNENYDTTLYDYLKSLIKGE